MKKKMLQSTLVALVLGLVLCTLLSAFVFETRESEHTQEDLQRLVSTMAQRFDATASPKQEAKTLSHAAGGLRVTIVGADGAVLGDSAAEETKMENHAQRGEIADAATSMYGVSVRRSVTTGSNTMYVATRLPDGSFLRVAATYPGMLRGLAQFLPAMLTAALIALMVGGAFADRMSKSISAPIVELSESLKRVVAGETKLEPNAYKYEELQDMAVDINSLSDEVDAALKHLESERDRIGYVLDNMGEGLVLLDGNEEILLLNNAAAALLCCPRELAGKNIIYATRNTDLLMTIDRAVKQQTDGESILRLSSGQTIEARAHAIASGALLVLQDVSAQHSAVRMRQEFFASASHELKTPITSIKGFAELLCSEEIAPAQQREFAARILKETTTMQNLIGDIIMISRLETGDIAFEREILDVAELVRECVADAAPLAECRGVTLQCEAQKVVLSASRRELCELIGNLVQNAIRYNAEGGTAEVRLWTEENNAVLRVSNSSGYIPPQYRERVFERFFRIDKGRSKSMGGTGLGLAIVKHVATVYHANIRLESSEQEGTVFTVRIPLEMSD